MVGGITNENNEIIKRADKKEYMKEYMKKRRQDPIFNEKQKEYSRNYNKTDRHRQRENELDRKEYHRQYYIKKKKEIAELKEFKESFAKSLCI